MPRSRMQTWLAVMVAGAGLLVAAVVGRWAYVSATPPLHPDAQSVRTKGEVAPDGAWARKPDEARELVRAAVAEQNLPGLSVAVGAGNGIVWAEGFGWADLESRVPVTPETRFRIGTASTALTSVAAGLLVQQGRLKLDERIQTYVPEFPEKPWPVTVRQVMAHRAGLRSDSGDEGPLLGRPCKRPVEGLEVFKDKDLLFEPGTQYRYSAYGWILMSAAIEAVAGEPFLTFMRRQVFDPLGMDDTKADDATEGVAGRATPYFPRFAADPRYGPDIMREVHYSCYAGASVFVSTPSDLVRLAMALERGTLLEPATVQLLRSLSGPPAPIIAHDGESLGGMVATLMTFTEHDLVIAVTSNTSYADTRALAARIGDVFTR
jgi:serine beta-lactamase-like protein LACTB